MYKQIVCIYPLLLIYQMEEFTMNSTKKMKRILAMCVSVMIVITALLPVGIMNVFAQTSGMDILLVVDDTGSMKQTDPGKLTQQAIQKFVDVLPSGVDFKLGVATYSDKIEASLELGHSADEIKEFANTKITQNGDFTDAAVGINWAMEQFEKYSDATRKKAIILIGDGENDYGNTTEAASNQMLADAIAKAEAQNIEIYTMAINPKSAEFRQYFADVASRTKGKSYEPADANAVEDDIKDILPGSILCPLDIFSLTSNGCSVENTTFRCSIFLSLNSFLTTFANGHV